MAFNKQQKEALLELKGVGPTVIKRFEEIGIYSFDELSKYNAEEIADMVASLLKTTCWKNSPQARSAINAAINLARQSTN